MFGFPDMGGLQRSGGCPGWALRGLAAAGEAVLA